MLTKDALLQKLREPRSKRWIDGLVLELLKEEFNIVDLLDLTTYPEKQLAFRSAWLLDAVVTNCVSRFVEHIDHFITYAGKITNPSCQRHYARIYMYFTSATADEHVKQKITETNIEPVIEQCFDWLINPKVKVAVKASSSEVLFNLIDREPWIAEELHNRLRLLMINGSPAIKARGRRLLSKLTIG